jgi:hypothetical protein
MGRIAHGPLLALRGTRPYGLRGAFILACRSEGGRTVLRMDGVLGLSGGACGSGPRPCRCEVDVIERRVACSPSLQHLPSEGPVAEEVSLGYFSNGVGRALGAEEVPEPEGELIIFEAFFVAGLRLPMHRFVVEVLRRFEVQVYQLTPNAVVALAKYVWAVSSYGGQPSVEVFTKNYCLHWQKRKIGDKIAQFGSCTFTPRTGKTLAEVVEIVPCARNKWGNWWDFWFYVAPGDVEGLSSLPLAILCSHYYMAFPRFEVAKEDEDEGALRYAARLSSGRDLVEEFIAYGVWPLAHGWALGEVTPRRMPILGSQMVQSPAFAVDLRGRDAASFVREVEAEAAKIVGKYVSKTETLRSWDIRGSNV